MVVSNSQFITDLKVSKYYQRMFLKYDVIMIYLAGSNLAGVTDDRSDYDLIVITTDSPNLESPNECLKYEDIKVHWYYRNIADFIKDYQNKSVLEIVGNVIFSNISEETIVYKNENYLKIIDFLFDNKDEISKLGALNIYTSLNNYVNSILEGEEIKEQHYSKLLYHLCYASYVLTQEEKDIEFLKSIKRIRWQPVSDDYKNKAVKRLKLSKEYVENIKIDIEASIQEIKQQLKIILEST